MYASVCGTISGFGEIGASNFVLRVFDIGYFLPFVNCLPRGRFFNLPSAFSHSSFASSSIEKLFSGKRSNEVLRIGFGVNTPVGCSVQNFSDRNKLRLILDLRFPSQL